MGLRQKVADIIAPSGAPAPQVFLSELVRLECRVGALKQGAVELLRQYDAFFALPGVSMLGLGRAEFDRATELRARFGLKTPDALHLAAAELARCDAFLTGDQRLSRYDLGVEVLVM